jgi:hypothetical protein
MQLLAKLVQVQPIQSGEGKNGTWKKQDIIVETDGSFPKKVCISIWGDKINESVLKLGNNLDIQFDVESREYNGKWYTDCKAWKVDLVGASSTAAAAPVYNTPPPPPSNFDEINQMTASGDDDLPF